jgi:hypothetical protein
MRALRALEELPGSVEYLTEAEANCLWGGAGTPSSDQLPAGQDEAVARGGRGIGLIPFRRRRRGGRRV